MHLDSQEMTVVFSSSIRVPLRQLATTGWGRNRQREPISLGIPLPRGSVRDAVYATLDFGDGRVGPVQVQPLETWPDGSVRWALCDFVVDVCDGRVEPAAIVFDGGADDANDDVERTLRVATNGDDVVVETGVATFSFTAGRGFPFEGPTLAGERGVPRVSLQVDIHGTTYTACITRARLHAHGALRADVLVDGRLDGPASAPIEIRARVELFAASATARLAVTLHNPKRARHAGGTWGLGDPASVLISKAALLIDMPRPAPEISCAVEAQATLQAFDAPFEIYQASSGGAAWNGPVHRNRDGRVALDFKGYRLRSGRDERRGDRATPLLLVGDTTSGVAVAVPEFWQQAPRALAVDGQRITVGLFPHQASDPHELQGGEQKTHRLVVAFSGDRVSDPPLAWCHDPTGLTPPPEWHAVAGSLPGVLPTSLDPHVDYQALVDEALDPAHGFGAKREHADEFGWRNFGDVPADHESAFQPPDRSFVSHYNNQYDAIAGFAIQFMRTGDGRWHQMMDELARHVRDIDIYHTVEDKSAYNGGLFWHTQHYVDAGLSTHRTYPPGGASSGGPSAEHNYNAGLLWHHRLTGDPASRDAAIGLGQWVLDMDDGRRTLFRWLDRGATGLANLTAGYYGPGRGAGHSILALVVAHRLTGEERFLEKADELIRRTAHPEDDIDALDLLDAERRWSYTAFLQALGIYLEYKEERGEGDASFDYARLCLLHYARWMCVHEVPYLDRPEKLEYPTETWAAQDLRKSEVFLWAVRYGGLNERGSFLDRATFFFRYAVDALMRLPTHVFTRPTVLVISFGARQGWFERYSDTLPIYPAVGSRVRPLPRPFVPQKTRALRRARRLAVVCAIGAIAAILTFVCRGAQ
jgi:hypothetical protein